MTTIAELGLAVNSESAVQAADNLEGMVEAGARAEQAISKVAETSEQAKARLLALGKAAMESSSYQEALNRAYEATAGASAAAAREQLNQSAALRQSAKAASESSVAQEKVAASEKKATAAIAEQRTQLEKLLGQIDPTTAALARLGDQQRQLEKFKAAGILDPGTFNDYKAKIEQAESGLVSFDKTVARTGVSAKQSAAALRMLPAQFSDIFVSLQGGQAPLTVFLQQGSQIKDSFGGIGAAAKAMGGYIVGLVNPFTLAAAAAVGLGVAYYKGSEESTRFKTALILTGSAAGASADSLASMASKVGETVGTTGKAADALNQLASGGKIAGESFEAVAIAALSMEKATGRAVADTVAEFVKIGKDPVAAAKELNDQYGFLTASVYSQIVSLKEQGREQEAVKLLTDTYADTVQSRSKQVIDNLSLWERAWNGVAGAAAQALDGLKNVGRESSYEDQIKALRAKLTGSEAFDVGGVRMNPGAVSKKDRDDIQAQINFIELQRDADRARAQYLADQSRFQKDAISGIDLINREAGAASTNVEKLNDRLAELGKARTKNLENNSWSTEEQAKYEKAAAALRKQIADAQKKATKVESSPVDLTSFNDADNKLKALTASYQNSLRILDASQKAGLISSQQYAEQKSALISKEKTEVEAAYNGQITALESVREKSTTTGAQRIQIDQKIADARSKMVDALKKLDADQEVLSIELRGRLEKDEAAVKAFAQATQDSLNLDQRGLDSQLAGFGLSDRQRQRLQEDLKIQQDYQDKLEKLSRDRSRNQISESVYQQETQILNDALETRLQKQEDFYRKEDALRGDWSNGVSRAWRNYVEEAGDAAGMTESAFGNAFKGIEDVFVDFITTGKASFKDFANSVIADLARIVVKQQVIAPLLNAVFGGGGGGNGATSFGSAVGSLIGGGNASDSNGWGGMVSLGKNLYSAWSNLTGVGSSIASGYASGGVGGALSGGVGYYGNLLSSLGTTLSGGLSSIVGAITGSTATQVAANAATSAALQGAVAQGAAQVGTSIGIGGAAQVGASAAASAGTAAAAGAGAGFYASLAAMASNPVGWVIAAVTSAYQSGKLYDQGVRWNTKDVMNTDLVKYSGGIGQATLAPLALTNNVLEKVVGGKMAAIFSGSTFASAIITKVSEKIFGGSWATKDGGLSLGIEGGDFLGRQYIDQKKKGGLFGKDKKRTRYSALDPQMQEALQANYYDTQYSVLDLFTRLNVSLNDGVMDGLNVAATKISTKGKTGEEIQEAITKWFGGVADSMVSAVDLATKSGLGGYNFEALTTFVNNLYSVNDAFTMLGLKLYDVSVSTGFMAEQLVAMAGGAEAFNAANSKFFDSFYTDVEKTNYTLATVTKQFKAMDVALPGSRTAFRSVVDALDLTTESGRKMYVTLTGLAESASQAYTILEQQLTNAVTNAQGAVQRAISAQQKKATEAYNATNTSLSDMVSAVTENVNGLNSVSTSLSTALKALRGDSDDAVKMLRAQAQATLQSALATARSGKSLSGFTGLEDALDTVSNNNTDLYGSMEDFARDQGRTANVVAELNAINGKQLTSAEASLAGLKTQIDLAKAAYDAQMAQYDQALEFAQAQMDALNGVDTSIMGVTAAINAMNAAVVAALQGQATGAGKANTSGNNATLVETLYQSVLGRGSEAAGASYWGAKLQSGEVTYEQAAATIAKEALALDASKYAGTVSQAQIAASKAAAKAYLDSHKTPAFATGGLISGPGTGTSDSILARLSNGEYVMNAESVRMFGTGLLDQMNAGMIPAFAAGGGIGEVGPQLEVTGPSGIYNANQAASMLKGGGDMGALVSELKQMREENKSQRFQIAKTNQQVASLLQKWDAEGTPKERDYAL
nr:phage tail tape measure protein [uncultured Pseudomonas sp.]